MRTRKKLSMWSALPPYLGGKRRLCSLIFREIDRILPRKLWSGLTFLDAFLGGGSVSLFAKAQGFEVVATDVAERSVVVGEALIANSRIKLCREDVLRLVAPGNDPPGRIEKDYVPWVFTRGQGRLLDRALRTALMTRDPAKSALYRLLAIRVALLAHPMSQVRPGTIHRLETGEVERITPSCLYHYIDGLRLTHPDKLWELAQQINAGVFQGSGQVYRGSVFDVLPTCVADVAYFDPPYPGVMSYEKEYRILDEILEGKSRRTSPFTAKDGAGMLDALFEQALHVPVWVLSLGNAVVGLEELEAKMAKHGRKTKAIALKYQHLPAVATQEKKRENREFLVVGWDPTLWPLKNLSIHQPDLPKYVVGGDVDRAVADVHPDANLGSPEAATSEPLPVDGLKKSESSLPEQATSEGRSTPVTEQQSGVDDPDPVLGESGLDGEGEGRFGTSGGHDPTVH